MGCGVLDLSYTAAQRRAVCKPHFHQLHVLFKHLMGIWKPDLTRGELFTNYHRESSRENSPGGDNTRKVKAVLSLIRYLLPELS